MSSLIRKFEKQLMAAANQFSGSLGVQSVMDIDEVPSSLAAEVAPILRVSNEIEPENPRAAYLCGYYAYEKAHELDPNSDGLGVRQFKAALLRHLERLNKITLETKRMSDAQEMKIFYEHFYGKYTQSLQNGDKADRARLSKDYQTAQILFEVLMAVNQAEPFEVEKEMKQAGNHIEIPLHAIKSCTQNFNERNFIGKGGYGNVYKGFLTWGDHIKKPVAVKRLNATGFQGNKEFYTEVTLLSQYKHENIITLIGFCHENNEMILVYEYASRGSLDTYLRDTSKPGGPSWPQLLKICIGVASALDYLHNHVAEKHRIIHRDIKSANILLDENWNAKLADFGLARIGLANQENTFVATNPGGTHGYLDPLYGRTGLLTKESDVYSFGVVLFEVLCGRLAYVIYNDEPEVLCYYAPTCYKNGELEKIIDPRIRRDIKPRTLLIFSAIAYRCLQETREERPTIAEVVFQLKEALKMQLEAEMLQDVLPPPLPHSWR